MLSIFPEEEGKVIKIEQVRTVEDFAMKTGMRGIYRFILISPATSMNLYASNALLKTLEEPSPNTQIILLASEEQRLSATIRSRCQRIFFPIPSFEIASAWLTQQIGSMQDAVLLLKLANGAPLAALRMQDEEECKLRYELFTVFESLITQKADPLHYASQWQGKAILSLFNWWYSFLSDLLRLHLGCGEVSLLNTDFRSTLHTMSRLVSSQQVLHHLDYLQELRRFMVQSVSMNKQLLLEDLLIRWAQHASG